MTGLMLLQIETSNSAFILLIWKWTSTWRLGGARYSYWRIYT